MRLVQPHLSYWLEAVLGKSTVRLLSIKPQYVHLQLAGSGVAAHLNGIYLASRRPISNMVNRASGGIYAPSKLLQWKRDRKLRV